MIVRIEPDGVDEVAAAHHRCSAKLGPREDQDRRRQACKTVGKVDLIRRSLHPKWAATRQEREVSKTERKIRGVVNGAPPLGILIGDGIVRIRAREADERAGKLVDGDRKCLVRRHRPPPVGDDEGSRQRCQQRVDRCFPFDLFLIGIEHSVARPPEDQVERRLGAIPGNVERATQIIIFGAGKLSQ